MGKNTYLSNTGKNLILLDRARKVIQEFKRESIDFLVLKGLYLAFTIYPDIGSRPMVDVDFLVKRVDLNRIDEILTKLGYENISPQGQRIYGCDFTYSNKHGVYIDIHWDLCQYERFKGIIDVTGDFWRRSCEFSLEGVPLRTLSTEDHILYVSLHYCLVHLLEGVNGSYDLFYLISDKSIDWQTIIANANKYKIRIPLYCSLREARRIAGLKVPDFVYEALKPSFVKETLLDYLQKHKTTRLRYFCQALMVGCAFDTLKVLWRALRGIPRVYKRSFATALKNIPDATT